MKIIRFVQFIFKHSFHNVKAKKIISSIEFFPQSSLTLDESNLNASSLGDISTDDNAVDLPIKNENEQTVTGLSNNANERIPILDDDDDVIVLPQEEPVITEIPDDDDHEPKQADAPNNGTNSHGEAAVSTQDTGISTQPDNEKKDQTSMEEGRLFHHKNYFVI